MTYNVLMGRLNPTHSLRDTYLLAWCCNVHTSTTHTHKHTHVLVSVQYCCPVLTEQLSGQCLYCRLGYFERKHTFYSQDQLVAEITKHYTQQVSNFFVANVVFLDLLPINNK